jgi:3-phenylpropionate/trans-cinnamate dioxygenase ferredoxin reductase component
LKAVDYVIVGGGVAGGHAAFEIRKHDKSGTIVVVNSEDQLPYDRPPLSKEYLAGKMKRKDLFFRTDSYFSRSKVQVLQGRRVQSIDASGRTVTLDDGSGFSYDQLLIATGGEVRRLDLPGSELAGILYLRTLRDCDGIRFEAKSSKRAAILGGGFIGCELAATLRAKGLKVTLIEIAPRLLSAAIDEETSRWVQDYHSKKGVKVLSGTKATGYRGKDGRVNGVELEGGEVIPADFVAVGVGIIPNTGLAEKAGLKVDKGVLVDEHLRTSAEGVYAAGDIARFYSPIFKRYLRVEHVDVAQKHGAVAGSNMAGKETSFDELPYFFSNQFDLEINAFGDLSQHTAVIRRGKLDPRKGFIQFYFDGAILNGILSVNADWNEIERAKTLVQNRKTLDDPSALSDESRSLRSFASSG